MKHLRKFEELDYSTYKSAADKLQSLGQKGKAKDMMSHAIEHEKQKTNMFSFNILVGDVKTFPDAKFVSLDVARESQAYSLIAVFKSGENNTHTVRAVISRDGAITWREGGNKFADRKSTNDFLKLIKMVSHYQESLIKLLDEMKLTTDQLSIVSRTFYN